MADESGIKIDLTDIEVPPDYPGLRYANNVFVTHTAWDFSLVFAHFDLMPGQTNGRPRYSNRLGAKVVVSPQLIKGVIRALQTNVDLYEKQFGTELPDRIYPGTEEDDDA